ncbi:MAG: N-6 DNA methylase [Calditrichaeota bacterium]|nr:N-6 DNA methylase [Calditrichota bacterium]
MKDVERREYGDFQTPDELTDLICSFLSEHETQPFSIIEPTFGKGSFILSSLNYFDSVKKIVGVEIYEEYIWETKFKILAYFLDNAEKKKPEIILYQGDIFKFDLKVVFRKIAEPVLVLGNPPWVTNSELSTLNSENLPLKRNLKKLNGLEAITGKGNFDIGEYISLLMLENFSQLKGKMAFLIKNAVIKNLVHDLQKFGYTISDIGSYHINAKQFFNAAVDASLFTCNLGNKGEKIICEYFEGINTEKKINEFGWLDGKFISDIRAYKKNSKYDGISPFEWRQGVKHDSSKVFELIRKEGYFENGLGEKVDIEGELVYGLLKSSDLKDKIIDKTRKFVIITQHTIGESTHYIQDKYPRLYEYLMSHKKIIDNRKSSIYKNKPPFSIFGIGEYSFKPYKIAISGLYKKPFFALLLPDNNKPIMLDDTCYFLGFDDLETALFTWCILTDEVTFELLNSIAFLEAKRPYTKEILMRIAINKIAQDETFDEITEKINSLNFERGQELSYSSWEQYLSLFKKNEKKNDQLFLFESSG